MTQQEKDVLRHTRAQALLIRRIRERSEEEEGRTICAMRIDAMPRGSASTAGLDAGMIRREEMARMLRREEARFRRLEKKAREAILLLKPELYAFCALYYIEGMSMERVGEALDRSARQCRRYKREIEDD